MNTVEKFEAATQSYQGKTGKITISRSCSGTVNIAKLYVGRKVVYETRAWGTSHNAFSDAEGQAQMLGIKVKAQ